VDQSRYSVYHNVARYPKSIGAPTAAEGQTTSRELSAPMPDFAGQEGLRAGHARLAEPERGRREAAAHDPPKPGIQGTGPLGVASGSIPEGDLHPLHWMAPSNLGPPFGPTCRVTALACVVRGRGHGMPGASQ